MSTHDGGLSAREHDEMRDLVLAGTQRIRPAGAHRASSSPSASRSSWSGRSPAASSPPPSATTDRRRPSPPPTPTPHRPRRDGWIAYASGWPEEDIYFVRPGSAPHLVLGSDDEARVRSARHSPPMVRDSLPGRGDMGSQGPQDGGALVITDLDPDGKSPPPRRSPSTGCVSSRARSGRRTAGGSPSVSDRELADPGAVGGRGMGGRHGDRRDPPADRAQVTDIEWAADGSQLYIADETASWSTRSPTTRPASRRHRGRGGPDRVARRPLARRRANAAPLPSFRSVTCG